MEGKPVKMGDLSGERRNRIEGQRWGLMET